MKKCSKCKEIKEVRNNNYCLDCNRIYKREYYKKKSDYDKKYSNARDNYKITKEKFSELMQSNHCEICNKELKELKDKCIDHNHNNNEVRGILCNNCNQSLGKLKESKEILLSMIKYIDKYNG